MAFTILTAAEAAALIKDGDNMALSGGFEVLGHTANCVAGRYKSRAWAAKWLYGMGTKGYSDANAGA